MQSIFNILNNLRKSSDYEEVKSIIRSANRNIVDPKHNIAIDQTNLSSVAIARKIYEQAFTPRVLERDEYLGIVLFVPDPITDPQSGMLIRKVYVDVPGLDAEDTQHPDIFADENLDLSSLEYKAFYPASEKLFDTEFPETGDIVRVKVSKNYFAATTGNPTDNIYLGVSIRNKYVLPTTNSALVPKAAASLQLTKEAKRDSLFLKKPTNKLRNEDLLDLPYKGEFLVSSLPAPRIRPTTGLPQSHYALDVAMPVGTPIYAGNDQEIINVAFQENGAGKYIKATNGQYKYLYMHLSEQSVKKGDIVKRGSIIGTSGNTGGSTGPHLHFEIRDMQENKLNPLYFLKGTLQIKDSIVEEFGLTGSTLAVPFPQQDNVNTIDAVSVDTSEQQTVPAPVVQSKPNQSNATNQSPPTNRPKMFLKEFVTDKANGVKTTSRIGSKTIKAREDLISDLAFIKEKLNQYNIAFTCENQDISIINNNISLLAKVGLEIRLNPYAGLSEESNLDTDDYFIGPDYSKPIGNGYKLIVYANVRRAIKYFDELYVPEKKIIEAYDPKQLKSNGPPTIKKSLKAL